MLVAMLCTFDPKWFQPPGDKYDRWRHCVNKSELHPPNNRHVFFVRIIRTHSRSERILIFFPNFTIFKVPLKSLEVEFQADLNKL